MAFAKYASSASDFFEKYAHREDDLPLLKDIQELRAARTLWEVQKGQVTDDYYIGFSHALNLAGVITDDEWRSVRIATGGDS